MNHKRQMLTGVKLVIGLGLMAWLLRHMELSSLFRTVRGADPTFISAALASYLLASFFEIAKFRAACEYRLDWLSSFRLTEMGLFFNNFLPSNIGGDGYKLFRLKQAGFSATASIIYLLTDRMAGAVVLLLFGGLFWLLTASGRGVIDPGMLNGMPVSWRLVTLLAAAVAVMAAVSFLAFRKSFEHLRHRFRDVLRAGMRYLSGTGFSVLALSSLFHLFRGWALFFLALAFGHGVPYPAIMVILGLALTVSMLPISLGGLGVREGTLAFLLARTGISSGTALAIALFNLGVLWTKSLIGGLIFLRVRHMTPVQAVHVIDGKDGHE